MKLIGSRLEEDIRQKLLRSEAVVGTLCGQPVVRESIGVGATAPMVAFCLGHTPLQNGDHYVILINGTWVACFDCEPRSSSALVPGTLVLVSTESYRRGLKGKRNLLKLMIALDLTREKQAAASAQL